MRDVMRRNKLLAALPALALVGLAAGACAPFHAGAAATVGNARITTDQLRNATQRVLSAQPKGGTTNAPQGTVQRTVLGQLVSLDLLQHLAGQYGVAVTPLEIGEAKTAITAGLASTGGAAATMTEANTDLAAKGADLQQEAEVEATYEALVSHGPVTTSQVTAAYDAQPDHGVYAIAAFILPASLEPSQLVTALKSAPASALSQIESEVQQAGGEVETPTVDGSALSVVLGKPADTAYTANEIVGPETLQGGESIVVEITAVHQRTLTEALAPDSVERAAAFDTAYYAPAEKSLGVHINPRFGGWTPTGSDVESLPLGIVGNPPAGTELSTPLASPTATTTTRTAG
jgi:hypothetical protein